jgi:hypothetical protein
MLDGKRQESECIRKKENDYGFCLPAQFGGKREGS